jgi:hypothetical protein
MSDEELDHRLRAAEAARRHQASEGSLLLAEAERRKSYRDGTEIG